MLAAEDPNTHFGEFSETPLQPFSGVREDGIRHMSTVSQVPPYHLLGQVANLSADALAAARDGLDRKIEELQSVLTDPWRNVFRLAGKASNDKETWNDLFGSVVWRNTSAKAFASTVLGLTQIAQMLGVPEQELWQFIPGVTSEDVAAWQLAAQRAQAQELVQQLVSQSQQTGLPPGQEGAPPQAPPPAGQGVPGQTQPMPPGQTAPGGTPAQAALGPGGKTPQ
jgi:Phage portal protein, SPP1 Gp6-like